MSYENSFSSSSFQQINGGGNEFVEGAYSGGFDDDVAQGNYSSYAVSSSGGYGLDAGFDGNAVSLSVGGDAGGAYYSSSSSSFSGAGAGTGAGFAAQDATTTLVSSGNAVESSSYGQQAASSAVYATDAQGFFKDPNPQVVRRAAVSGPQTYTQRVMVRFLQPPAVPPPGPLIIKEVRPPQPPPPPPLFIRQRPPPPPTLPPIVIREAPPKIPPVEGPKVITKMLPPLPVPPRSVIIERLPPLPPKPRDVIVERWLPYRIQQKRRVIIQRAPPPVVQKPRNIIIYYEAPKAQIVRRFQNLGVQRVNPAEYVARYGSQLEDSQSILTHARQAGVVEDISPPAGAASSFRSADFESYQSAGASDATAAGYTVAGGASTGGSSAYEFTDGYATSGGAGYEWVSGGTDAAANIAGGFGSSSSSYESYGATGDAAAGAYGEGLAASFGSFGFSDDVNAFGNGGSSSYESYSTQQTYSQ